MIAMNPRWEVAALDENSVQSYCAEPPVAREIWQSLGRAHQSDLLRTQLLIEHGGVWMDPTVFCVRPLDDWLSDKMKAGVFFFQKPGLDRLISNWFIAAEADNVLLRRLIARLADFWADSLEESRLPLPSSVEKQLIRVLSKHHGLARWRVRSPWRRLFAQPAYMVYHYLLSDMVLSDSEIKAIWSRMPEVSAVPPHRLQRLGLLEALTGEGEYLLSGVQSPLFKLTWKNIPSDPQPGTLLARLYERSMYPAGQA